MSTRLTVLVLGVGGNVSQGILKSLQMSSLTCKVIGACVSSRAAGLFTVDRAYVSPYANDPGFVDWLISICRHDGIQAVLCGSEPVLAVLSIHAQRIRLETGAICIVSPPQCLSIGADKLATCQWLEKNGFNFPRYAASENQADVEALVRDCGYPLIAKPRAGKSAQGLIYIRSPADLAHATSLADYVVQELLGDDDSEYTVGCFSDRDGRVRGTIAMRRELLQGTTFRAEIGDFPSVRNEAIRIAAHLLMPLMPQTSAEALRRLSCEDEAASDDLKGICAWGLLAGGQPVEKGDPLFPRLA